MTDAAWNCCTLSVYPAGTFSAYDHVAACAKLPASDTPYVCFADKNNRLSLTEKEAVTVAVTVEVAAKVRVIVPGPAMNELEMLVGCSAGCKLVGFDVSTVPGAGSQMSAVGVIALFEPAFASAGLKGTRHTATRAVAETAAKRRALNVGLVRERRGCITGLPVRLTTWIRSSSAPCSSAEQQLGQPQLVTLARRTCCAKSAECPEPATVYVA